MKAWLESATGDCFPVVGGTSIGRSSQNQVVLKDDTRISRRHALIHQQSVGEFWLLDLGSANGVYVNGKRLRVPIKLEDGDQLHFGDFAFVFRRTFDRQSEQNFRINPDATTEKTVKIIKTQGLWLLVADIEGFTPLSQKMQGDELAKLVGKWIFKCKDIIEANNGNINKFLGDGYLAWWPSPNNPVMSVVKTVKALRDCRHSFPFDFRMAVHFGQVTVDNSLSEGENALLGPEVNYVFRMERLASSTRQSCLTSIHAAEHLKAYGKVETIGQHELTGFTGAKEFFAFNPTA